MRYRGQMCTFADDAEVDKAEQQLRKAQNARKRALQAERKPFLDEIKKKGKEVNARLQAKEKAQAKADAMSQIVTKQGRFHMTNTY